MAQGRAGPRVGSAANVYPIEALSAQNKSEQLDKQQKDFIYIAAQSVGADLMEATGGADISPDNLLALQFRGYLDYSLDDILNSHFDDLDDLNADVRYAYQERRADWQRQRDELLAEIAAADLPPDLFKKVEFAAVEGVSRSRAKKNGESVLLKDIGIIQDTEVDDEEKLSRYAKYRLAQKLIGESGSNVGEHRILGIALDIFYDKDSADRRGKRISSFQSEIFKASNETVSQADVEMAAEAAGWYDLIYPERRQAYLNGIQKAAQEPINVPLKDKERIYGLTAPEVSIDLKRKRLLVGETAVKAAFENGAGPQQIRKLGELLIQETVEQRLGTKGNCKDWQRGDFIKYGNWLLKILEPYETAPDVYTLINAFQLGVGPSLGYIEKEFGSSLNFYKELNLLKKNGRHQFDDMTYEDIVAFVQEVAAKNDGRVSAPILRDYYYQQKAAGIDVPSYQALVHLAEKPIGRILEDSGFRVKRKCDAETCAKAAARFFALNQRWPKSNEFSSIEGMPSWPTVRRYCGNMAGLKQLASEYLRDQAEPAPEVLPAPPAFETELLAA